MEKESYGMVFCFKLIRVERKKIYIYIYIYRERERERERRRWLMS